MNCVRAGNSSAHCETINSSVLCGACSRWIKNKEFPLPNFPRWNFFHRQRGGWSGCYGVLCSWPNMMEKNKGGVEQNQISLLLMPRLSCVSHFLINPCKAALHPMKLQSISFCVMCKPLAKWILLPATFTTVSRDGEKRWVKNNIWGLFDHLRLHVGETWNEEKKW